MALKARFPFVPHRAIYCELARNYLRPSGWAMDIYYSICIGVYCIEMEATAILVSTFYTVPIYSFYSKGIETPLPVLFPATNLSVTWCWVILLFYWIKVHFPLNLSSSCLYHSSLYCKVWKSAFLDHRCCCCARCYFDGYYLTYSSWKTSTRSWNDATRSIYHRQNFPFLTWTSRLWSSFCLWPVESLGRDSRFRLPLFLTPSILIPVSYHGSVPVQELGAIHCSGV